jgi:hypothetical protein
LRIVHSYHYEKRKPLVVLGLHSDGHVKIRFFCL